MTKPIMIPLPECLANGPVPTPVSLRIHDLPDGNIILEVATTCGINYAYLIDAHMQWLEEQLRLRNSRIVTATPTLAAQLAEFAQTATSKNGRKQ